MQFINLEVAGRIATVAINRPEVRNALHPAAYLELSEIYARIEQDDGIWVRVLTGTGDHAFCAGHDLKRLAATSGRDRETA